MTSVKKFNVNEEGMNLFFGRLEAKIMNILWLFEGDADSELINKLSDKLNRLKSRKDL